MMNEGKIKGNRGRTPVALKTNLGLKKLFHFIANALEIGLYNFP